MTNKNLILFGAGASYGSTQNCEGTPPLGAHLFKHLESHCPGLKTLPSDIRNLFENHDFESAMSLVPNDSRLINPIQKAIAIYLSSFKPTTNSAYLELLKLIKDHKNLNIATLNYDILIELSMEHLSIPYRHGYDFTNGVGLLKLHGSSSYLPDIGQTTMDNCVFAGPSTHIEGLPIIYARTHEEINDWCNSNKNNSISPCLSLYNKKKQVVTNRMYIDKIQRMYKDISNESKRIFVVGTRFIEHDPHVWSPLAETNAEVVIIDPDPDEACYWLASQRGSVRMLKCGFYDSVETIARIINRGK